MDKRERLERGISDKLEISPDLISGVHRLVITGSGTLFLENHRGIVGFSDTSVAVAVKGGVIRIGGSGLMIPLLTQDTMEITGEILSYTFGKE